MGRAQAGLYKLASDRDVQVGACGPERGVATGPGGRHSEQVTESTRTIKSSEVDSLEKDTEAVGPAAPESEDRRPLSVLMMHFARDSNGNCKQLYSLCEERFVHTRGLQKAISLSEAAGI